jgi:DNA-binding SARP family transcriptional activator
MALPFPRMLPWPAAEHLTQAPVAALSAPWDFLLLGTLAVLLQQRYADVIWVRLAAADADPGGLLLTLLGAVSALDAGSAEFCETAVRCARRGEWQRAYQLTGEALGAAAARPAALVLEGAEHLDRGHSPRLDPLVRALMPAERNGRDLLLVSGTEWDCGYLVPAGRGLGPERLRLDSRAAAQAAATAGLDVTAAVIDRVSTVTGGAAGALGAAFSAGTVLGPAAFTEVTARAVSRPGLLSELCGRLLADADRSTRVALAVAARLGFWHPGIGAAIGLDMSDIGGPGQPWWLELADGWRQLDPAWRAPLGSAAGTGDLDRGQRTLLADHLSGAGAGDLAVELYLSAGQAGRAADTAAGIAADLADAGCWPTLARLAQELARPSPGAWQGPGPEDPGGRSTRWRLLRRGFRWRGQANSRSLSLRQAPPAAPAATTAATPAETLPAFTVHLLGELRVTFGDRPVQTWVSGRGRAVFEYLIVHRHSSVRRDRLMSVFWPESPPDAARNNLNVAIHGLRQTLRAVAGDRPLVICRDHAYLFGPDLDIWVDTEAFEERLKSAGQHVTSGEPAQAQADLEAAISLYQGDFLADDPYEQWGIVTREHLRLCYLDALGRLGRLRFASADYSACAETCLRLLARDNCREDAYCLLMRCYSRQGQPHLALRQYHSCAATLRQELRLSPAPATTDLFHRILRRENV